MKLYQPVPYYLQFYALPLHHVKWSFIKLIIASEASHPSLTDRAMISTQTHATIERGHKHTRVSGHYKTENSNRLGATMIKFHDEDSFFFLR